MAYGVVNLFLTKNTLFGGNSVPLQAILTLMEDT